MNCVKIIMKSFSLRKQPIEMQGWTSSKWKLRKTYLRAKVNETFQSINQIDLCQKYFRICNLVKIVSQSILWVRSREYAETQGEVTNYRNKVSACLCWAKCKQDMLRKTYTSRCKYFVNKLVYFSACIVLCKHWRHANTLIHHEKYLIHTLSSCVQSFFVIWNSCSWIHVSKLLISKFAKTWQANESWMV